MQKTAYPKIKNISIILKVHNIIETYKSINKVITKLSGAYNNFISNRITATFNYIKTPINHMVKNKINEISILKELKLNWVRLPIYQFMDVCYALIRNLYVIMLNI